MGAEMVDMVALVMSALVERDSPGRAFVEKILGAILVLLGFLVLMNLEAVVLRRSTERRW